MHMKRLTIALAAAAAAIPGTPAQAREPTKTVEFIVPAGTGGGADQMARAIQGIVAKHNLMKQSMMVIDNFVLWVNAENPAKSPKEYIEAAKKAGPGKMKMAGTGSRQEDQIIT